MTPTNKSTDLKSGRRESAINRATLSLAGDICLPESSFSGKTEAQKHERRTNFLEPFATANTVICNLEAPISAANQPEANKAYTLKNSREVLDLFDSRFVLSLANNHIMDFGREGLEDTLEHLTARGFAFAGAGRDLTEASRFARFETGDLRGALVSAADPRYHAADNASPGTLPADPDLLSDLIRKAGNDADIVVVSLHMGMEYTRVPSPAMIDLADRCATAGATIVQFHHAHCVSGFTRTENTLVLWGTGNYGFSYVIPAGFSAWRQSAVWQTIFDSNLLPKVEPIPVILDREGWPTVAAEADSRRIQTSIATSSHRIRQRKHFNLWRLASLSNPVYLWLALNNYYEMARRTGLSSVVNYIGSALRANMGRDETKR